MGKWVDQKFFKRRNITFLAIREVKIKTTLRFHFAPVRMSIIKKRHTKNSDQGVQKRNF